MNVLCCVALCCCVEVMSRSYLVWIILDITYYVCILFRIYFMPGERVILRDLFIRLKFRIILLDFFFRLSLAIFLL